MATDVLVEPTEPQRVELGPVVLQVLNLAVQGDLVRAALASFIEGRGLEGEWRLEITAASLTQTR